MEDEVLLATTASPSALTYAGAISGAPYDDVSPLYGTTQSGGAAVAGTVFELLVAPIAGSAGGKETTLLTFRGANGAAPDAGLLMEGSGRLYGTTSEGGTGQCSCGIVFRLTPAGGRSRWTETVLHTFGAADDGRFPKSALITNRNGRPLFGTTPAGDIRGFGTVCR